MNVGSEYIKNLKSQFVQPILIKTSKNVYTAFKNLLMK